jgi:adenylyltransferase/sulfurtransferase
MSTSGSESIPPALQRYSRQIRFAPIGVEGQKRLRESRVLLCGCGALGSALADGLARAGVGFLRIVDRDFVELSNLQRQVLFDEVDVAEQLPKVHAAVRKLSRINSQVEYEPLVVDIDHRNIRQLAGGIDLIVDGLDNFETRFLINDLSLDTETPWVYGGCVGSTGQSMLIRPGRTACLRCLIESPPGPDETETCDTAGVLGPIVSITAAWQVSLAIQCLTGRGDDIPQQLLIIDAWDGTCRTVSTAGLRDRGDCPACRRGERDWLSGKRASQSVVLCGRNAVQIRPAEDVRLDLAELATRLSPLGSVSRNPFLLKLIPAASELSITVFPDGRAIVQGTSELPVARHVYGQYIGA